MTDKYTALEELARKATQDRWRMAAKPSSIVGWPIVSDKGRTIANLSYCPPASPEYEAFNAESEANGRFIVATDPSTILSLIAEARAGMELWKGYQGISLIQRLRDATIQLVDDEMRHPDNAAEELKIIDRFEAAYRKATEVK